MSGEKKKREPRELVFWRHVKAVLGMPLATFSEDEAIEIATSNTAVEFGEPPTLSAARGAEFAARVGPDSAAPEDQPRLVHAKDAVSIAAARAAEVQAQIDAVHAEIAAAEKVVSEQREQAQAARAAWDARTIQTPEAQRREMRVACEVADDAIALAGADVDVIRRKLAPLEAQLEEARRVERGAEDEITRINLIDSHRQLLVREARERIRREAEQKQIDMWRNTDLGARLPETALGFLRSVGLEVTPVVEPPPKKFAVSLAGDPHRGVRMLTEEECGTIWRLTGLQAQGLDRAFAETDLNRRVSAAEGLDHNPQRMPPSVASPAIQPLPATLSADAVDRLAHYVQQYGNSAADRIMSDGSITSGVSYLAHLAPPSANELRVLAHLPPLSREALPRGEDRYPSGWAGDPRVIQRLELALQPDGSIERRTGIRQMPQPGQVTGGVILNTLSPEAGREFRRRESGAAPATPPRHYRRGSNGEIDDPAFTEPQPPEAA